jgi:hypothetical protein
MYWGTFSPVIRFDDGAHISKDGIGKNDKSGKDDIPKSVRIGV